MSKSFLLGIIGVIVLLTIGGVAGANLQSTPQSSGSLTKQPSQVEQQQPVQEDDIEPIVAYEEGVAVDEAQPNVRKARNSRYNNAFSVRDEEEGIEALPVNSHWWLDMPALPVDRSTAVVIGTVKTSKAFLSDDKKGVYSEYAIQVEEALKNANSLQYVNTNTLTAERVGGAVRFKSGHLQRYRINDQGMPKVGRRYAFFLKLNPEQQDYTIVTGYELREGIVVPLDGRNSNLPFMRYQGIDEGSFLIAVRESIAKGNQ